MQQNLHRCSGIHLQLLTPCFGRCWSLVYRKKCQVSASDWLLHKTNLLLGSFDCSCQDVNPMCVQHSAMKPSFGCQGLTLNGCRVDARSHDVSNGFCLMQDVLHALVHAHQKVLLLQQRTLANNRRFITKLLFLPSHLQLPNTWQTAIVCFPAPAQQELLV